MILQEYINPSELAQAAATYIVGVAREAIKASGHFNIALSGGNTPGLVYDAMVAHPGMTPEIVQNTHLFFGDERSVPHSHPDSNVGLALNRLVNRIGIPAENVHTPDGGAPDLEQEALRYEEELKRLLPISSNGQPVLDLVWLGMGDDGHTASLFPGTRGLAVTDRTFIANEVPQLKTWRLTLTFEAIKAARGIVVMLAGKKKAPALAEIFSLEPHAPVYPIEQLRGSRAMILWMVDRDATSWFAPEQRKEYTSDCGQEETK